jgi:hypothetical protein
VSPDHRTAPVEEDHVEGKAHAECVDAGAALDQKARSGARPGEKGKTEQAGSQPARDADLATEHCRRGETAQASGKCSFLHQHSKARRRRSLPGG